MTKDKYQTPVQVADYMVSLIPKHCQSIYEPTPGAGNLIAALERSERDFDIYHPKSDFFTDIKSEIFGCVLMNPPFSEKSTDMTNAPANLKGMEVGYHILQECMQMSENIVALMPWFLILDSDKRLKSIQRYGLKSVTALPRKTFGYARIQTAIFVMEKGYKGPTLFNSYTWK